MVRRGGVTVTEPTLGLRSRSSCCWWRAEITTLVTPSSRRRRNRRQRPLVLVRLTVVLAATFSAGARAGLVLHRAMPEQAEY